MTTRVNAQLFQGRLNKFKLCKAGSVIVLLVFVTRWWLDSGGVLVYELAYVIIRGLQKVGAFYNTTRMQK
jgi:hypothetical protein